MFSCSGIRQSFHLSHTPEANAFGSWLEPKALASGPSRDPIKKRRSLLNGVFRFFKSPEPTPNILEDVGDELVAPVVPS